MSLNKVAVSVGLEYPTCQNIQSQIESLNSEGFDYAVLPLVHCRFTRHRDVDRYRVFGLPEGQVHNLSTVCPQWLKLIVCNIQCNLKSFESSNAEVRDHAKDILNQELDYITYLGIPFTVISIDQPEFCNFARTLLAHSEKNSSYNVWIKVPIRPIDTSMYRQGEEESKEDTWDWWNKFRSITSYYSKFELALEVNGDICDEDELDRWLGEPLRSVFLSTHVFQTNRSGFPVLNTALANFLKKVLEKNLQVVIVGVNRHEGYLRYVQYMQYLKKHSHSDDPLTMAALDFEDYLQFPLQPLANNLTSFTYEVFEKDPIKYLRYQEAVRDALLDRVSPEQADSVVTILMVVGAGRGPLVTASLNAAKEANRKVRVYAVEKNMSAVVGLMYKRDEQWAQSDVTIISEDMRTWDAPEKADIMVSELLGSFGDNELSPECLYAAQKYLKEGGISIPYNYTSYIAPIMSHKLYSQVKASMIKEYQHPLFRFEQPYVVYQRNKYNIAPPQPCFKFEHPCEDQDPDNSRYTKATFHVANDSVLHGVAGYFDTYLYKDIMLSIHPDTMSHGLISWFPVLFPIHEPIQLKANDKVEIHFWRLCDHDKVWYEWLVTKPTPSPIYNLNGRSYKMMKILE
ncbi:hypothetical protein WDU94_008026 [Cyamophila willieti]